MTEKEEKLDIAKTVAKGGIVNVISNSTTKVLGILFYFLILRMLPPEEAGLYFIAFAIFGFAHTLTSLGIPISINRFVPFYLGKGKKELVRPLVKKLSFYLTILSILICILLIVFSQQIADFYGESNLNLIIMIVGITTPFMLFFNFFCGFLRGTKNFISYALIFLFDNVLKIIFLTILIFFVGKTALNAFLSITLALFISTTIVIIWSFIQYRKFPKGEKIENKEMKGIFSYGIPMYISSLGTYLSGWTDTLVLGYYLTNPIVAAYNSVGLIARNIGPVISMPLSQIVQPIFANLHGKNQNNDETFLDLGRYYGKWALMLGLPFLTVFTVMSSPIMYVIFPQYEPYHWLIWIMGPTFFITLIAAPYRDALWAIGRSDIFMASSLIIVIPNLALNIILIPLYGVLGAAIASAFTYVLAHSIFIYYGYKKAKIKPHEAVPKIFLIALISAIVFFFYSNYIQTIWPVPHELFIGGLYLLLVIAPYVLLYIILIYFLIGSNNIEKALVKGLLKKVRG